MAPHPGPGPIPCDHGAVDRPPEEAAEDTSFARGLRVFLTIADRGEIRADELAALLDTPLSTIYRYLRTLTEFGFVERLEAGYRLGPRLHITGGATVTSEQLIRVADPILRMLVEETGETAIDRATDRLHGGVPRTRSRRASHLRVVCEVGASCRSSPAPLARCCWPTRPPRSQAEALDGHRSARATSGARSDGASRGIARDRAARPFPAS